MRPAVVLRAILLVDVQVKLNAKVKLNRGKGGY